MVSGSRVADRCSLNRLNPDVLLHILESVESKKDLARLSATTRWLRLLCKPLLYSRFTCYVNQPVDHEYCFLPAFTWPYVRDLTVIDLCPDRMFGEVALRSSGKYEGPLIYARNPYLCGVLNSPILLHVLRNSPNLTSISLVMTRDTAIHGVSWTALKVILTLPTLREFSAIGLLLSPSKSPSASDGMRLAPLRVLRYEPHVSRKDVPFRPEEDIIMLLLATCHETLEILSLPTEPTRIEDLASWEWPRPIRDLRLRGEQWSAPIAPFTSLFSKMRGLRTLVLQLTLAVGAEPRLFMDGRGVRSFPWPDLDHLSMSHPSVDDAVYMHLPQHVHILDLSCYPHLAERPWLHATVREYGFPIPTSAGMLDILRQCRVQPLLELGLEYCADEQEAELLRLVTSAFPHLRNLQIYRYGPPNDDFMEFVQSLARLANLSSLKLHLDLKSTPTPRFVLPVGGWGTWEYDAEALDRYVDGLQIVAQQLAPALCPSLSSILLWSPSHDGRPVWVKYNLMRSDSQTMAVGKCMAVRDKAVIYADRSGLQTYL